MHNPASSLRNSSEFIAPARTVCGFSGSIARLLAVPPNGPAIFQSVEGEEAATIIAAIASRAARERIAKGRLIIFEVFCSITSIVNRAR
jgi:hypothetical protein